MSKSKSVSSFFGNKFDNVDWDELYRSKGGRGNTFFKVDVLKSFNKVEQNSFSVDYVGVWDSLNSPVTKQDFPLPYDDRFLKYSDSFHDLGKSISDWSDGLSRHVDSLAEAMKTLQEHLFVLSEDNTYFRSLESESLSKLSWEEIVSLVEFEDLNESQANALFRQVTEIRRTEELIRVYSRKLKFLKGILVRRKRNLKKHFRKFHSFHFKNLDDYHSEALINQVSIN